MAKTPRGFRVALLAGWVVLGAAGILYARFRNIPNWAALPVIAAFLLEYPFYLVPAFPALRERFADTKRLCFYLLTAALLPYVAYSFAAPFHWGAFIRLAALALAMALWYTVLPVSTAVDLAFLALFPAVLLGGYFDGVYVRPYAEFKDGIVLGHISLIVMAVMVLLVGRRVPDWGYGFIPNRKEWRIGIVNFLYFAPVGLPLGLWMGCIGISSPPPLWKIAGTFLGCLWVVSLSEEFLVRGVLLHWIEAWTNTVVALFATSALFGLAHISLRGFPNWRWVLLATVVGVFCGRARIQAGSIRASMVTHALIVTTWKAFFAA